MKKITLSVIALVFASFAFIAHAQVYSSLHENFDVGCATTTGFPAGAWLYYNPPGTDSVEGRWHCSPTLGRENSLGSPTPGMICSGVWSSSFHDDTSYLITPRLDLHSYTTGAYVQFDSKSDSLYQDGSIALMYSFDTLPLATITFHDSTIGVTPLFSSEDSSHWVSHEIYLGPPFTGSGAGSFYIAFRYLSVNTAGSMWHIDNVNISPVSLHSTSVTDKKVLPIRVLGNANSSCINLSLGRAISGDFQLAVYDMMGRVVRKENLNLPGGTDKYTIRDLNLIPGMYFIKMGDGATFGAVKAMVQ